MIKILLVQLLLLPGGYEVGEVKEFGEYDSVLSDEYKADMRECEYLSYQKDFTDQVIRDNRYVPTVNVCETVATNPYE